MPGRAGLRVDEVLFDRVLSLATEMSFSDVSVATGLSRHLVSRIVEANVSEMVLYRRLVPPFVIRRVGRPFRIVDSAGEPVPGSMAFASGNGRAASFLGILGGPFLCDLPSLAWIGRLAPDVEAHLHPAAASDEARAILSRIAAARAGLENSGSAALASVSRRVAAALEAPSTREGWRKAAAIMSSLEGEVRRLCVPVAHVVHALPPPEETFLEAAHPANWILCGEFRPATVASDAVGREAFLPDVAFLHRSEGHGRSAIADVPVPEDPRYADRHAERVASSRGS